MIRTVVCYSYIRERSCNDLFFASSHQATVSTPQNLSKRRRHRIYKSKWVYGITMVALSFGLLGLLSGCSEEVVAPGAPSPKEDGTITVRLTGADAHNGKGLFCAVGATGDDLNDPANWLGVSPTDPIIAGGLETFYRKELNAREALGFPPFHPIGAAGVPLSQQQQKVRRK